MQATPAEVRAALAAVSAEDAATFDAEWSHALDVARDRLDLAELDAVLHRWRLLAWVATDPAQYRHVRATMARVAAGEPLPEGVPWEAATAGLARRLGRSA